LIVNHIDSLRLHGKVLSYSDDLNEGSYNFQKDVMKMFTLEWYSKRGQKEVGVCMLALARVTQPSNFFK
jgi:hypothetical protein